MPWHIAKSSSCPASKPYGVIKDSDDSVAGCHASEASAKKQLAALYANEGKSMSHAIDVDVVRALSAAPELRKATDDSLGLLAGHFSAFNNWYHVSSMREGNFWERMAPGAFTQTIAEDRAGMRVLFNHGFDAMTGDKVLGMIQDLREDETGGYYEVPLFDTSYNRDLLPGFKAGAYGASFRMKVQDDSWNDRPDASEFNPEGLPERTITRAKVMEFGPVTFPANPKASASVRSTTDEFYDQLRQRNQTAYEAVCRAAGWNPTDFAGRPSARSTGGSDSKDARPGEGTVSPHPEARKFKDMITMSKIKLPKPTTSYPGKGNDNG
jgi:HK97 family phage prohead protease